MIGPREIFERQYGEGLLRYRQSLRRLRRWFKPWTRDRFSVTRDAVARLRRPDRRLRILDFGCGDGHLAAMMAEACPDAIAEIVGVDISPSRVRRAHELDLVRSPKPGSPRLRFIAGDEATVASVREHGFDVVTCIAVFGQVFDMYGLGQRLFEALLPGGHMVAEFANYAYLRRRLRLLMGDVPTVSPASADLWPQIGWDSAELHYFSRRTSIRFLEQVGFQVVRVHGTGLLTALLPVWPSLLATGFVIVARRGA